MKLHFLFVVLLCVNFRCAYSIDFGVGKIAQTFGSGVSQAASVPASAISSIASRIPGVGSSDQNASESTTTSTTTSTRAPPTSSSTMYTSKAPGAGGLFSSMIPSFTGSQLNTSTSSSNTNSTDEEATTAATSGFIDVIKKPVEVVASLPGKTWETVSETVVNQDPEHSVKFYLYDDPRNLSNYKQIVSGQPDTLRDVRIAPNSQISLLIHGFMQDYNSSFPQDLKDTILQHIGSPVITVDWGHMADSKFGPQAARALLYPFIVDNVATVGEYVGDFIVFLKNNSVVTSFDQVHLLGFSLGSHVSGIAGHTVQNRTGEKIGRITGLDPAGPKFFLKTQERKLTQNDAKFVDVIHTSHLGYFLSLGHIDFFPNGGKIQPGCVETDEGIPEAVASLGAVLTGSCSHAKAWKYYLMSVKDNELYGCECNNIFKYELTGCEVECQDKVPFGESCPSNARGTYYLSIEAE